MAVKKKKTTKKKSAVKKKAIKKKSPAKKAKKKTAVKSKKKVAKKSTVKKVTAKKAPVKKVTAKKAPANKAPAKKKKVAEKKAAPKKLPEVIEEEFLPEPKKEPNRKLLDPVLNKIRSQLISQRNDLLQMIQSSQKVERNVDDITFSNEIDLASSLEGREMAFQLSSRERKELKMIEDALIKINEGIYGVCDGCSKNISVKRLQIMPLTPLCIECQENLETA